MNFNENKTSLWTKCSTVLVFQELISNFKSVCLILTIASVWNPLTIDNINAYYRHTYLYLL